MAKRRAGLSYDEAMAAVKKSLAVRHPDMNARWSIVNSPLGIIQMSTTGAQLTYVASDSDKARKDWSHE